MPEEEKLGPDNRLGLSSPEGEIAPERREAIRVFVLSLLEREMGRLNEHRSALQGEQGKRMSERARNTQIEGCENDIKLLRDAMRLFELENRE